MKGVILAAGRGSRLSMHNGQHPKVLLPVAGRAIIDHTLETFRRAGVTDVAVVIGHRGDVVRRSIGDGSRQGLRIRYVTNPDYELGNALSVYAAREFTEDAPFLLAMADHMISPALLAQLLHFRGQGNVLAVDFGVSYRHIQEGTRVLVSQDGLVTHIGKKLTRWNAIDAGVFRLTSTIFEALDDLMGEKRREYQLSQAIRRMIQRGHRLLSCDISGFFWQDVDTWEDLALVRRTLAG
jgi:choline kinase